MACATARAEIQPVVELPYIVDGDSVNASMPGFYAGVGIGQSSIGIGEFDDSDRSFKVFGGYTFNDYFAVELGYFGGGVEKSIPHQGVISAGQSSRPCRLQPL
jgi:hypothetical protein